jgi:hypothetical protein
MYNQSSIHVNLFCHLVPKRSGIICTHWYWYWAPSILSAPLLNYSGVGGKGRAPLPLNENILKKEKYMYVIKDKKK